MICLTHVEVIIECLRLGIRITRDTKIKWVNKLILGILLIDSVLVHNECLTL